MSSINKQKSGGKQAPMDKRKNMQEKMHLTRAPRQNPNSRRGMAGGKKGK
ncbi:MAG: hypothetical protein AAB458_01640 [Patescibacteria group bacterium]